MAFKKKTIILLARDGWNLTTVRGVLESVTISAVSPKRGTCDSLLAASYRGQRVSRCRLYLCLQPWPLTRALFAASWAAVGRPRSECALGSFASHAVGSAISGKRGTSTIVTAALKACEAAMLPRRLDASGAAYCRIPKVLEVEKKVRRRRDDSVAAVGLGIGNGGVCHR